MLDTFVWSNFRLGDMPGNVKLGRQTNYWGESYLFGAHAISYSQSPIDAVKAVNSSGIEVKEVFLPIEQLSARLQPTANLVLAGQYYYEWKPSRYPHGGTYFGVVDFFFEGRDRLPAAPGFALTRAPSIKPGNSGNWGLSAKMNVDEIDSSVGIYHRRFDDYNPWFQPNFTGFTAIPGVGTVPTAFRLVYPTNVSLRGASLARSIGPVAFSTEVSLRRNDGLNAAGFNPLTDDGPRGDTWHAVANGVYLLPKIAVFDTGSLVTEVAYSRLRKVRANGAFHKDTGSAACTDPTGQPGDDRDGCSTKDYLGLGVLFTPQWLQVRPSLDLALPMSLNVGLRGNAPSSGGGNEGAVSWSVGAKLTYAQKHEFQLLYADTYARAKYDPSGRVLTGGNGSAGTNDRGWLAFTFRTGF